MINEVPSFNEAYVLPENTIIITDTLVKTLSLWKACVANRPFY